MLFGFLLLLASLIGLYWLFFTEPGKDFLEKVKADREDGKSQVEREIAVLKTLTRQGGLDQRQQQQALEALKHLKELQKRSAFIPMAWVQVYQEINRSAPFLLKQLSPAEGAHDLIFGFLIDSRTSTKEVYSLALNALDAHPNEPKAKQKVLEIGRYHHGKSRRDGKVTIYDEQAIQNDIQVRSK